MTATLANIAWRFVCEPARQRLERALQQPALAQQRVLQRLLAANARTAFGKQHALHLVKSMDEYRRAVPISDYSAMEPWIERIKHGERDVLASGEVVAFERSSGSTSAAKYIPFNAPLRAEFTEAVRAWMGDLFARHPAGMRGPAWWLVSPLRSEEVTSGGIRVGMGSDDEYLGWWERRFAGAMMAVPASIARVRSLEESLDCTLRCLLQAEDLCLISVWNASYLTLLWRRLIERGDELLTSLARGGVVLDRRLRAMPHRAERLRDRWQSHALTAQDVWPRLTVLSAWADGEAANDARDAKALFDHATFQAKGLLATEGVITVPWGDDDGVCVPALNSHFLEFQEWPEGEVRMVHELERGREYAVILTTGGGLWRYRLGDLVRVEGEAGATPRLRFVGRCDGVCDLRGEKLHPQFVAEALRDALGFRLLAPSGTHYTLFMEGDDASVAAKLETRLRANPHYDQCRASGQLGAVRLFHVREDGRSAYVRRCMERGARLGTVKTTALSRLDGWERWFVGNFMEVNG